MYKSYWRNWGTYLVSKSSYYVLIHNRSPNLTAFHDV